MEGVTNLESANKYELSKAFEYLNKHGIQSAKIDGGCSWLLIYFMGVFQQELRPPELIFDADKLAVDTAIILTEDLDIYPKILT